MDKRIHPLRYPTLYMYIARLPRGLDSYPEAQTRADMAVAVQKRWPTLADRSDLPEDVKAPLLRPWVEGEWISETVFMAYHALIRDVIFRDDDLFKKFCYDVAVESFSSTIMRAVMHFVSPALLVMGASKRWTMMKRGTELVAVKSSKESLAVKLTYPPNMYHRCMLDGFAESFRAGINCTRVNSCSVVARPVSELECHFDAQWSFSMIIPKTS